MKYLIAMRTRFILCTLLMLLATSWADAFAGTNSTMQLPQSEIIPDLKLDLSQFPTAPNLPNLHNPQLPQPEIISDLKLDLSQFSPVPNLPNLHNPRLPSSHLPISDEKSHWFLHVLPILMVLGFAWFAGYCINDYKKERRRERQKQWEEQQAKMRQEQDRATAERYKRWQESHRWYADENGNISSNINDL